MRALIGIGLMMVACLGTVGAEPARFNEAGFLLVDGKPRLILGVYDLPKDRRTHEDELLGEIAASGFDVMRGSADKRALDRLHAHGLAGWVRLRGLALREGDAATRARLADTINALKDHPGLFCWEGPDEALWLIYWSRHDWYHKEQPARLRKLIDRAADRNDPRAAEYGRVLDKAVDYTARAMWKESEDLYATLWRDLGATNPHPEMTMTAALEEVPRRAEALARGWELVGQLDPSRPRWQNHAPCNSKQDRLLFSRGATAVGCDIYPAPNYTGVRHADMLPTMEPTAVGVATELMRASGPGKSCWMVLQGCGWHDLRETMDEPLDAIRGRRPTPQETRFMAYDALLHGANGILYWGTRYIERDSDLWKDIMRLGKELRAVEPALVAPEVAARPVVVAETNVSTFDGGDPKLMLRQVGDDWVLIAVNEWRTGVAFDVQNLPETLEGKTLHRLYSDEEHEVRGGAFRDGMVGHDAHIYATSRRFETK